MIENSLRRPGERRDLMGFLGEMMGGFRIAAPLRFDMQAAQTKQPRGRPFDHFGEDEIRRGAVARELRRLRLQEQSERLVGEMFGGLHRRFAASRASPAPAAIMPRESAA